MRTYNDSFLLIHRILQVLSLSNRLTNVKEKNKLTNVEIDGILYTKSRARKEVIA